MSRASFSTCVCVCVCVCVCFTGVSTRLHLTRSYVTCVCLYLLPPPALLARWMRCRMLCMRSRMLCRASRRARTAA